MGSFNTSCFASQQTIAEGDRCFVLPIIQQASFNPVSVTHKGLNHSVYGAFMSTCYANAYWTPFAGMLEATYADYGRFTILDTPANRTRLLFFFDKLAHHAAVTHLGENTSHDTAINFKQLLTEKSAILGKLLSERPLITLDTVNSEAIFFEMVEVWEQLTQSISESRLFCTDLYGPLKPIQLAVLQADACTNLVEACLTADARYRELTSVRHAFDLAIADLASVNESNTDKQWVHIKQLETFKESIKNYANKAQSLPPGACAELDLHMDRYLTQELSVEALYCAVSPTINSLLVLGGLDALNLTIIPMRYAPEDYSNELGQAYAQFVNKTSAAVNAIRAAWLAESGD
ncbi:MAG: hypothetical protein Q7U16_13645 [Agitococcus sp.]|nr:hypothetical protein [Agitococcus sp.]